MLFFCHEFYLILYIADFPVLNFLPFYLPATFRFRAILLILHLIFHDNQLAEFESIERWLSFPAATLSYNSLNTGAVASRKRFHQSNAPRCAVVEQFAYIQSIPFSATNGIKTLCEFFNCFIKCF